jgi:hypothetical protein
LSVRTTTMVVLTQRWARKHPQWHADARGTHVDVADVRGGADAVRWCRRGAVVQTRCSGADAVQWCRRGVVVHVRTRAVTRVQVHVRMWAVAQVRWCTYGHGR